MELEVDCLIVGGGPAGLIAATYLGRFRRNAVLVDSGASRASWIPVSHNVLGFSEGVKGPALLEALREQADKYGVRRLAGQIERIDIQPQGFLAAWKDGAIRAVKVLLATGGLDVEPQIADARSLVEAGLIRHCPICDAYEATGKRIALVAYGHCRIKEALLLRGYTDDLTVLTLGHPTQLSEDDRRILEDAGIRIVSHAVQKLTRKDDKIAAWTTAQRQPLLFDTVYSALGMHLRSELAIALGAQRDEDGALLVDRHQQTTVAGLYAAGDVVHGLSQVNVAAGEAAIAATAINASLPAARF